MVVFKLALIAALCCLISVGCQPASGAQPGPASPTVTSAQHPSAEAMLSQGNVAEIRPKYKRAMWLVSGLLVIIASLMISNLRHKRLAKNLRESESRWMHLFRGLPGSSLIVNDQCVIEEVNDAMCEMAGYSRHELIGRHCDLICSGNHEQCPMAEGGKSRIPEHEGALNSKDGRAIPVLKSAHRISLAGRDVVLENFQDISQRKKAEGALQRSEETERSFRQRLTALHEVNTAMMQVKSRDELSRRAVELAKEKLEFERIGIWFVSENANEIVGSYSIGKSGNLRDERTHRHQVSNDDFMCQTLAKNEPGTFCEEGYLRDAAGQAIGNGTRVVSTLWDGRAIIGFLWTYSLQNNRDVPEVQQKVLNLFALSLGHLFASLSMEQERMHLEAQLRQSAKMEAVGRLAGGIAHDFNNQLTVVTGYCDLLMRDLDPGGQIYESVEQIDKSARQASVLTGELLNFSRKEILKPEVIDPNRVLWGMEKSLSMLGEDIKLEIHATDDLDNIRVDVNQFQQVIMNMAINARDAMASGGRLSIKAENYDVDETLAAILVGIKPGPYVRISFTDTGIGMDKETQQKVFEPFFTTKDKGKGTGLGLSLVYGFVQQSGGQIDIDSELGHGTTFHIYLPHVNEKAIEVTDQKVETHDGNGNETVLVVEDDAAVRRLVVRVLREFGYAVMETGHPEEALRMVRQTGRPVDLLISDVVMPGLSGPKLAETLNDIQPGLKVLYMSGYTEETVVRHGVEDTSSSFLHKPFSPERLGQAIYMVLHDVEENSAVA